MAGLFDDTQGTKDTTSPVGSNLFDDTQAINTPAPDDPEFIPGVQRGLQNLQAMTYGAGALAGEGLKKLGAETVGQKLKDIGIEGYKRNIEEAKQYPKKHSFKDIYTGKTGVGGAIDWAQGTLGELVPSMVEAAGGAAIGSMLAPGAGTAAGAFAGRTILKKGIEKSVQKAMKKGVGKLTESEVRKQITKQALKKAGGKVGIGAAVMPIESGSSYVDLLEEHGVDAPETALFFGALKTSLEFVGGNSKLVDTFVDAIGKGSKELAKKSAKEILTNVPEEALQEGGQEFLDIMNTVVNTDEKLLTAKNVESIIESMAAGAVGGGAGAVVNAGFSSQAQEEGPDKTPQEIEIDRRATNILTQDKERIDQSVQKLNDDIKSNQGLLTDVQKLDAKARELNIDPKELTAKIIAGNNQKQSLIDKINAGLTEQSKLKKEAYDKLSPEDKAVQDAIDKLETQRIAEAQKINDDIKSIDEQLLQIDKEYQEAKTFEGGEDLVKKKELAEKYIALRNEKNALLEQHQAQQANQASHAPYTTREGRQQKYEDAWGTNTAWETEKNDEKDAVESTNLIEQRKDEELERTRQRTLTAAQQAEVITDAEQQDLIKDVSRQQEADIILQDAYAKIEAAEMAGHQAEADKILTNAYEKIRQQDHVEAQLSNSPFKNEQQLDNLKTLQDLPQFQVGESDPENVLSQSGLKDISYDGIFDRSFIEEGPLYQFTIQSGPFAQRSFSVEDLTPEGILDAYNKITAKLETRPTQIEKKKVSLEDIKRTFTNQDVSQADDGTISVQFKNGKGLTIKSIQEAGQGFVKLAIETGQMSKNGKILGITVGNEILLDKNFADNATLWHENKHVLDNLGMITPADNSALNKEFNKLHKAGKLNFALSKHKDPKQRMVENRANMFAQIMLDREAYRNTSFGKVIQRVMDFFQQLLAMGNQTVARLAQEVESGKIYERQVEEENLQSQAFQINENATEQELATSIDSNIKYDGKMDAIPGITEDLHNFTFTLPDGQEPSFSISGKVTQEKIIEQLNKVKKSFNQDVNFQVSEQRLPQAEYDAIFAEKNNLLKEFAQQARIKLTEVRLLADKAMGSISTRLKNVDPELPEHLRRLDFDTSQAIIDILKVAKPILDATNGKKNKLGVRQGGMSPEDKSAWNWARLNSDKGKIEQLAQKYNLTDQLTLLREKLDKVREDAIKVGYDVGFIDEYWPRVIKDQEGFLQATQEISQRPIFTEAIRAQAKKLGLTQEQFEHDFPEVKADIISNLILNQSSGIGGPGNIQSRVFETIDKDYAKFYMDADAALMQYVYSMTKKIEARKFFGKVPKRISDLKASKKRKAAELTKIKQLADMARLDNPEALIQYEKRIAELNETITLIDEPLNLYKVQNNYTENIGSYILQMMEEGRIGKKDEKMVRDILDARFHEHGTTGIVNAYKNFAYIDTMGSPLSAITQIGDLAWAMYVGKVWTPKGFVGTGKNLVKAISGKSDITKEDLGIERIAQEFADGTTLSKGVSKVFKLVGLEKMDSIGKEVLINNALDQFKAEAKADPEALANKIKPTFGNKSTDVVQEILADTPSDNVKMLLYSRLLDFQPVALSEMPEFYLNSGNGRVVYMLKTYTLKQMDVFRKEVVHNLKSENPQQRIQGITNMIQLMALLTIANATADEMKDFLLGKETRFSDNVIENLLTMGGASRYTRMQVTKDGIGSAVAQQVLPPMKFINAASKDLYEGYQNYVSGDTSNFDHARIIDSIPGIGKLYYWHLGRGEENKQSITEKDFKKASKDAKLFKKQLENATDKRLFIESNLDRFKQMKLQENFQSALNRNKAVINKLEKIPSTENIQLRLGQLKAQREQILQRYFDAAKTLN